MSRKSKISAAIKEQTVKLCSAGKLSRREAAHRIGVDVKTIQSWSYRYASEGSDGLKDSDSNRIYPPELKRQAVLTYLSCKGSQSEICNMFHIRSKSQLRSWIKVYNSGKDFTHKMSGGSRMKDTRRTTLEERIQIAKECIENENNYGAIALKYGVSYQQVRSWVQKYKQLGEAGLEDRRGQLKREQTPRTELEKAQIEIENLKRELYLAEVENRVLKKLQEIERRDALDK